MFFPAYAVKGVSQFEGVEVPPGCNQCIQELSRIKDLAHFPILLDLTMTGDWQNNSSLLVQAISFAARAEAPDSLGIVSPRGSPLLLSLCVSFPKNLEEMLKLDADS